MRADIDRILDVTIGKWRMPIPISKSSVSASNSRVSTAIEAKNSLYVLNAWTKYVFRPSAPSDVNSIGETISYVMEIIESFGPSQLNLSNAKIDNVHPEHLVAVLRSTFMCKEDIPGWQDALTVASKTLSASGFDPKDVLIGLK